MQYSGGKLFDGIISAVHEMGHMKNVENMNSPKGEASYEQLLKENGVLLQLRFNTTRESDGQTGRNQTYVEK